MYNNYRLYRLCIIIIDFLTDDISALSLLLKNKYKIATKLCLVQQRLKKKNNI